MGRCMSMGINLLGIVSMYKCWYIQTKPSYAHGGMEDGALPSITKEPDPEAEPSSLRRAPRCSSVSVQRLAKGRRPSQFQMESHAWAGWSLNGRLHTQPSTDRRYPSLVSRWLSYVIFWCFKSLLKTQIKETKHIFCQWGRAFAGSSNEGSFSHTAATLP